jgi:hypothetical protein
MTSEWMTLTELAAYSKLSHRQLQRAISQPFNALPSYFVAGRRMVRQGEYDAWAMGNLKTRKNTQQKKRKQPLDGTGFANH